MGACVEYLPDVLGRVIIGPFAMGGQIQTSVLVLFIDPQRGHE